jgi:hypothetical protein
MPWAQKRKYGRDEEGFLLGLMIQVRQHHKRRQASQVAPRIKETHLAHHHKRAPLPAHALLLEYARQVRRARPAALLPVCDLADAAAAAARAELGVPAAGGHQEGAAASFCEYS